MISSRPTSDLFRTRTHPHAWLALPAIIILFAACGARTAGEPAGTGSSTLDEARGAHGAADLARAIDLYSVVAQQPATPQDARDAKLGIAACLFSQRDFDGAAVLWFDDQAALQAYLDEPGHAEWGAEDMPKFASPDLATVVTDDASVIVDDPRRADAFYAEVRKYWPALPEGALLAGYAGIRPKTAGPHEAAQDFLIQGPADHGLAGLVNLFGIESPGLTSSLAIGDHVTSLLSGSSSLSSDRSMA